jgi:phosphoadenosine phosphosulfate reductase
MICALANGESPVQITMVKKRLENGDPCDKCAQTEEMLRRRGYWDRIDDVVWALEGDDQSAGAQLGRAHGIEVAPFFVLRFEDGSEAVYTSPLRLIRDHFSQPDSQSEPRAESAASNAQEAAELAERFAQSDANEIIRYALERFGSRCVIAFSGAQDSALIDMASKTGLPFRVFFVDSGRLHTETYALLDELRRHYGIEIASTLPDTERLTALLNEKGQNSFLRDGHRECCNIRRVEPLARALGDCDAWIALHDLGRELAPPSPPQTVEWDERERIQARPLLRFNPLANWDSNQVWSYIRKHEVPHNEMYKKGYRIIGCEPCTRSIRPDQEDREGLWWWEEESGENAELGHPGDGI